jgi:hypothetical protein
METFLRLLYGIKFGPNIIKTGIQRHVNCVKLNGITSIKGNYETETLNDNLK